MHGIAWLEIVPLAKQRHQFAFSQAQDSCLVEIVLSPRPGATGAPYSTVTSAGASEGLFPWMIANIAQLLSMPATSILPEPVMVALPANWIRRPVTLSLSGLLVLLTLALFALRVAGTPNCEVLLARLTALTLGKPLGMITSTSG
jgi:hypothetical protein